MKKIICFVMVAIMLIVFGAVTVSATESTTEIETVETVVETVEETEGATEAETTITINKEDASEIMDLIENSEDKSSVILALIDKYGCSEEDAEEILQMFVALGDKYLDSNEIWVGFKKDIQEDTQFWIMVIMCVVTAITIILGVFVLLCKTNPTMRRAMLGMVDTIKLVREHVEASLQTLGDMRNDVANLKEELAQKEETILSLTKQMADKEASSELERKHMLAAAAYNLRMMKLIFDRMAVPIADKSTVDHWYAKGVESIKNELNDEDTKEIESMCAMLNSPEEE
jgi:hypothetical protein